MSQPNGWQVRSLICPTSTVEQSKTLHVISEASADDQAANSWIGLGVFLAIVFILAAYMGCYYAMIGDEHRKIDLQDGWLTWEPSYRVDSPVVAAIFRPAYWVDYRLRPDRYQFEQRRPPNSSRPRLLNLP